MQTIKMYYKFLIVLDSMLSLELKSTAEPLEFETLLKQKYLSQYSSENDCLGNCFSCSQAW